MEQAMGFRLKKKRETYNPVNLEPCGQERGVIAGKRSGGFLNGLMHGLMARSVTAQLPNNSG